MITTDRQKKSKSKIQIYIFERYDWLLLQADYLLRPVQVEAKVISTKIIWHRIKNIGTIWLTRK